MLQLTPRLFVCPTNDAIYCTGKDNQFNLAILSEYAPLQRSERCQHSTHTNSRPFLHCGKRTCALFWPCGGSRLFSCWRGRRSEVPRIQFALAVMSPSKVCPQRFRDGQMRPPVPSAALSLIFAAPSASGYARAPAHANNVTLVRACVMDRYLSSSSSAPESGNEDSTEAAACSSLSNSQSYALGKRRADTQDDPPRSSDKRRKPGDCSPEWEVNFLVVYDKKSDTCTCLKCNKKIETVKKYAL